jgi:twitching motility protein PilT
LRTGSCDSAYSVGDKARFRVNIFSQRGNFPSSCANSTPKFPTLAQLKLPEIFNQVAKEKTGLVLVTGATGSGKSTTLAAVLNEINAPSPSISSRWRTRSNSFTRTKKATFNQREMGSDFSTFATGLRAALRQAPKVVLVGEMRDRETVEIGLSAAETGHLVLSTLHTIDAGQTINRILGMFETEEQEQIRLRLADTLRWVISQRLHSQNRRRPLCPARNHGLQPPHQGNHRPRRKRRQKLLRNHRIQPHLRLAQFRPGLPRSLRTNIDNLITEETALLYLPANAAWFPRH